MILQYETWIFRRADLINWVVNCVCSLLNLTRRCQWVMGCYWCLCRMCKWSVTMELWHDICGDVNGSCHKALPIWLGSRCRPRNAASQTWKTTINIPRVLLQPLLLPRRQTPSWLQRMILRHLCCECSASCHWLNVYMHDMATVYRL